MQPITQSGEESAQTSSDVSQSVESAKSMGASPQLTPLTTSTGTPSTTQPETFKASVSDVMTSRPARKRDSDRSSAELMRIHRMTWTEHNGKRVLNIPATAQQSAVDAVYAALRREAKQEGEGGSKV